MEREDRTFKEGLLPFYQDHALATLLPFWERALDKQYGGIYTCFDNTGKTLVSRNKYTWSQGRFVWLWSRLSWMASLGHLAGDAQGYLTQAQRTVEFLLSHAFLENGNCAYLLSERGEMLESVSGRGFDTSIYCDCFVLLGLAEYSRISRDLQVLERALQLYDRICIRIEEGNFPSEPYPIPQGLKAHSVCMMLLRVTQVLVKALQALHHDRSQELFLANAVWSREILENFFEDDGRVAEFVSVTTQDQERLLLRHLNPGHVFESMWFIMEAARDHNQSHWIQKATEAVKTAASLGWDPAYGGFFRFVDRNGGMPKGVTTQGPYERLILDTWDAKLWWPHSEALYTTLLAYELSGEEPLYALYRKIHQYVFQTFPNPDGQTGEWIQIRDRLGHPLDKCVALPVKDPYHILQDVLLIIELLHASRNKQSLAEVGHR